MEVDPSKSTAKFEYPEECKLLKAVSIGKFKKDKGDLINTPLKASLLYHPQAKSFYLVIQSKATFTSIYEGLLIPDKS